MKQNIFKLKNIIPILSVKGEDSYVQFITLLSLWKHISRKFYSWVLYKLKHITVFCLFVIFCFFRWTSTFFAPKKQPKS